MNTNPVWKIVPIKVSKANQLIQVDFKLPKELKQVKGIFLSVKDNVPAEKTHVVPIGELSLSFNSRQIHPIHFTADYSKDFSDKFCPLELDILLEAHQNITGFYFDSGKLRNRERAFLPYTLNLYLECYK